MTTQPDIIWNEQCLGIRIGEQVCTYLKKHDAEYQRLQKKILELTEKYPVIETFMESNQSISLTEVEHKASIFSTGERKGNDRRRVPFLYGTGSNDLLWSNAWKN